MAQRVSIFDFVFLVGTEIDIASSAVELNFFVILPGNKKYKSIIITKEKKEDKSLLLAKDALNILEGLISKALSDLDISHGGSFLVKDVLKKSNDMKHVFKNLDNG